MSVHVESDSDALMPEATSNYFDVFSGPCEERCVAVTQVMEVQIDEIAPATRVGVGATI